MMVTGEGRVAETWERGSKHQSNDRPGVSPAMDNTTAPSSFAFLQPAEEAGELGRLANYRVKKLLGQGGMGMVFHAIDVCLQRAVALKVMRPEMGNNLEHRQRFLREARATAAIKSDHIVTIHQVSQENDVPFLAMEFLEGMPLRSLAGTSGTAADPGRGAHRH